VLCYLAWASSKRSASEMHKLATAQISLERNFLAWANLHKPRPTESRLSEIFSLERAFIIPDLQNSCSWLKNLKNQVLTYPIHSEYQKNIFKPLHDKIPKCPSSSMCLHRHWYLTRAWLMSFDKHSHAFYFAISDYWIFIIQLPYLQ